MGIFTGNKYQKTFQLKEEEDEVEKKIRKQIQKDKKTKITIELLINLGFVTIYFEKIDGPQMYRYDKNGFSLWFDGLNFLTKSRKKNINNLHILKKKYKKITKQNL